MVFGTFDMIHPGHEDFFKQARQLAEPCTLIVSIARDSNVARIKNKLPRHNEQQRLKLVEQTGLADQVILGSETNYLEHIIAQKPDFIALGYDQQAYTERLAEDLKAAGLTQTKIVRLKPFFPEKYKTSLLR